MAFDVTKKSLGLRSNRAGTLFVDNGEAEGFYQITTDGVPDGYVLKTNSAIDEGVEWAPETGGGEGTSDGDSGNIPGSGSTGTYQPYSDTLTLFAGLEVEAYGLGLNELADAAALRTYAGLGGAAALNVGTTTGTVAAGDDSRITGAVQTTDIGSTVQAYAAALAAIAGLTPAANKLSYFTSGTDAALTDFTSQARTLLAATTTAGQQVAMGVREVLTANRTYYVRTDGSDSNDGLANTSGGAFLTPQKAMDVIAATLDLSNYTVTVQIADGTYTGTLTLKTYIASAGVVVFQGNSGTPANVLIATTSSHAIRAPAGTRGQFTIKDLEVRTTTSGNGMHFAGGGCSVKINNVRFGACATYHCEVAEGASLEATGNFAVTGNAVVGFWAGRNGYLKLLGRTITYSNSPAFAARNWHASEHGLIDAYSMTFINGGTVTGKRYQVEGHGSIFTNSGGASYVPGNSAGTADATTYGLYY